jgi:hypothetical protein
MTVSPGAGAAAQKFRQLQDRRGFTTLPTINAILNEAGAAGWELATVNHSVGQKVEKVGRAGRRQMTPVGGATAALAVRGRWNSPNFQAACAEKKVSFTRAVVVPSGPGLLPVPVSTKGCAMMNCVVPPRKLQPGLKMKTSAWKRPLCWAICRRFEVQARQALSSGYAVSKELKRLKDADRSVIG